MKLFRAVILCAVVSFSAFSALARNINTVIINRTDGVKDRIAMNANLSISKADNGDLLMVHPNITVSYPTDLIQSVTVGYYSFPSGKYYYGDHELIPDAIEAPEVDGLSVSVSENSVSIGGLKTDVSLIDLQGKVLMTVKPHNGEAEISTSQLPAGVYIIAANRTTLKIKL